MLRVLCVVLAVGLVATACSKSSGPEAASGESTAAAPVKAASSPEEAVKHLETALKSHDFAALKEIYAQPFGELLVELNLARDLFDAQMTLANAMFERFGEEAGDPKQLADYDPMDQLNRIQSISVVSKESESPDMVRLTVRSEIARPDGEGTFSHDEPMLALKQGDTWRLVSPFVQEQGVEWLQQTVSHQKRVAQRLTEIASATQSGQYASLPEIQAAVQQSLADDPAPQVSSRPTPVPDGSAPLRR